MRIAMLGTRGVPAAYGGFETAVEEIGSRLAARGHEVTVYGDRTHPHVTEHLGMRVVHLPAVPVKQLETLSRSGFAALRTLAGARPDAAFVFNAANAPYVSLLRARGIPVAVHVDGLEWRRAKWGGAGRAYYRWAEAHAVRTADALIADAPGIAEYYALEFGAQTELIRYGAPVLQRCSTAPLTALGLEPEGFHVAVARFEPENHVLEIVEGYRASDARLPLAVVGSAPYSADYTRAVHAAAAGDDRIRLLGGVWDQALLDALYAHAYTYLHGHSVGGTNPSLLRAMGAGTATIAFDVGFNREVLADDAWCFADAAQLATALHEAEADEPLVIARGLRARERAARVFRWDDVAEEYERLAQGLAAGASIHARSRSARRTVQNAR
ncbi:glycosyltransferase [Agrococcus baldri]|uniref:Glycosyl transferase n=1 Tax=Agrococcus baldri TaxID=153730 RepID=A0AA87UQJ8_9MICO|nr:glycosyltransferase [Agrococcus baldri]GEK78808.1 glycosyl transferase [Agrococcus baldri]